MDMGLLTTCLAEVSLAEVSRWAAENGFRALEVPCLARGSAWYDGAQLVPSKIDEAAVAQIDELLTATGLRLSSLAYCENMLESDQAARDLRWKRLAEVVRAAARLRVPTVTCSVGRDVTLRLGECIATWARLAEEVIHLAEESGVRLALENSPQCGAAGGAEDLPGNLAFSPELWEKILTHARSDAVGLCLDPSHLHWLGVDIDEAVTGYAERIYHVRAKDTELFRDRLGDCSVLRPMGGWWRYRIPGLGEINWSKFLSRLQEHGYDGAVCIEHEDPVWTGSPDPIKRGLAFGRRHLAQFMV